MARRAEDLSGQKFGKLTAYERNGSHPKGGALWVCVCDCGNVVERKAGVLKSGKAKSCGCDYVHPMQTHGMKGTLTYNSWAGMKNRCNNPSSNRWYLYGARGITYDPRWEKFENFLADMGERPSKDHSIDRVDGEGNYCKENCRWATPREQVANSSRAKLLESERAYIRSAKETPAALAEKFGVSYAYVCHLRSKRRA